MPKTLKREVLGIATQSLDAAMEGTRQEEAERTRLASIVEVGGRELSAGLEEPVGCSCTVNGGLC